MKKNLITATLLFAISQPAFAMDKQEKSTNELIGLGSGALVGAAVAGPVGAVVAGLFGIMIADDVNDKEALTAKTKELKQNKQALLAMEEQYLQLTRLAKQKERQASMQPVSFQTNITQIPAPSSIQFKTASHQIESLYHPQLKTLASQLKQSPELSVSLSGFSDRRGDEKYNTALSAQRALSVKQYLLKQGVNLKQIHTRALGESQPVITQQSMENDFFDRRVLITLTKRKPTFTAAN